MPKQTIQQRLKGPRPVLLDGAMGTEILARGFDTKLPLWSAEVLLENPELIQQIHEDYIRAGAEIIVTNTFSTTQRNLAKKGLGEQAHALNILACQLAQQAQQATEVNHDVFIAGSIAPLEDCYSPELTPPQAELESEHARQAKDLKEGGADFILLETHITIRETLAAARAARAAGLPWAVCFCCGADGKLLGGETLEDALQAIRLLRPLFVGVNCVSASIAGEVLRRLKHITKLPIAVYAQGDGAPHDDQGWKFAAGQNAKEKYILAARRWLEDGACIIGSCCGSSPDYTLALKALIRDIIIEA